MTKEVFVTIEGLQIGSGEEKIVNTMPGIYHLRSGKHFIQYEEKSENGELLSKNTIKIASERVELSKKGATSSQMDFDTNELTQSEYHTPYGSLLLTIKTTGLEVKETPNSMQVNLKYTLIVNEEQLSENQLHIKIVSVLN